MTTRILLSFDRYDILQNERTEEKKYEMFSKYFQVFTNVKDIEPDQMRLLYDVYQKKEYLDLTKAEKPLVPTVSSITVAQRHLQSQGTGSKYVDYIPYYTSVEKKNSVTRGNPRIMMYSKNKDDNILYKMSLMTGMEESYTSSYIGIRTVVENMEVLSFGLFEYIDVMGYKTYPEELADLAKINRQMVEYKDAVATLHKRCINLRKILNDQIKKWKSFIIKIDGITNDI